MLELGAGLREAFLLERGVRFLNHGSFGATPLVVLQSAERWRRRMEANPDRFMREELPLALRRALQRLGVFLTAGADDLVFVENATAAVSTVLRALDLRPGDEILGTSQRYGAVRQAVEFVCRRSGCTYVEADVTLPVTTVHELVQPIVRKLSDKTRLVVLDHIASPTGLVFPIASLSAAARRAGARVLVDGAHAPGQLAFELPALGAHWYVGNCHKWLFAPKGTAFLWAAPDVQSSLHPLAISHGFGQGLRAEFDWTGTRDFSAWLALSDAIHFVEALGFDRISAYNHRLATQAAHAIAAKWDTDVDGADVLHGSMMAVRLPFNGSPSEDVARRMQQALLSRHGIAAAVNRASGSLWVRISGQIYNDLEDYRALWELSPASLRSYG